MDGFTGGGGVPNGRIHGGGGGSRMDVENCPGSPKPVEISGLRLLSDSGTAGGA